jgi:hypothetical protein
MYKGFRNKLWLHGKEPGFLRCQCAHYFNTDSVADIADIADRHCYFADSVLSAKYFDRVIRLSSTYFS